VGHKGSWVNLDLGCGLAAWVNLIIFDRSEKNTGVQKEN
jgi:hypothetical protein